MKSWGLRQAERALQVYSLEPGKITVWDPCKGQVDTGILPSQTVPHMAEDTK